MRIFLHVGVPKTGSTSIQNFFFRNRARLVGKGVLYPSVFQRAIHKELYEYALGATPAAAFDSMPTGPSAEKIRILHHNFPRLFYDSIDRFDGDIVLSIETLSARLVDIQHIKALHSLLYALSHNIKIVIYVREQIETMVSYYGTQVRSGRKTRLKVKSPISDQSWRQLCFDDLSDLISDVNIDAPYLEAMQPWLDYFALARLWSQVFDKANIIVRRYVDQSCGGRDVIDDFCDVIGLTNLDGLERPQRLNQSLDSTATELLRRLNLFLLSRKGEPINDERGRIVTALEIAAQEIGTVERIDASKLVTEEEAFRVREHFRRSNKLLVQHFGMDIDGDLFPSTDVGLYNRGNMSPDEELDAYAQTFAIIWKNTNAELAASQKRGSLLKQRAVGLKAANNALVDRIQKLSRKSRGETGLGRDKPDPIADRGDQHKR